LKEGAGAEDNLSAPSSFVANEHNEIYAFYTEKKRFFGKIEPIIGGGRLPLESAPVWEK